MKYQGKNWNGHLKIHEGMPEFFSVCFTCHSAAVMTVDLYIHIRRIGSRMILSVFSPYWIINKTSRILQYRAEDIHVKHPAEYRDIVLFSFKKKNIFSKNKVCLLQVEVVLCKYAGKKESNLYCLSTYSLQSKRRKNSGKCIGWRLVGFLFLFDLVSTFSLIIHLEG